MTDSDEVKLLPCEDAHNWEVGPCVNHLGSVTSWDINVRPREGDKGVVVIASVYSGEETARAILEAIQASVEYPVARLLLEDIDEMMSEFVDNWPKPKRVSTALALIAKTLRAATRPPVVTDEVVERVAPIVARALAKRHGLGDHMPCDAWMKEARVATSTALETLASMPAVVSGGQDT